MVERKISSNQISFEADLIEEKPVISSSNKTDSNLDQKTIDMPTVSEIEEFLTPEDFSLMGEEISLEELQKIDNHPIIDDELVLDKIKESNSLDKKEEFAEDQENIDEAQKIFDVYKRKEDLFKKNGDSRHIFLLTKGTYIQGAGNRFAKYKGYLLDDALVVLKRNDKKKMEFIHSFNSINCSNYKITYTVSEYSPTEALENKIATLKPYIEIENWCRHIDLRKEDINSLRNLLAKR